MPQYPRYMIVRNICDFNNSADEYYLILERVSGYWAQQVVVLDVRYPTYAAAMAALEPAIDALLPR